MIRSQQVWYEFDVEIPSYSGARSCLTLLAISGLRPQTMMGMDDMVLSARKSSFYSNRIAKSMLILYTLTWLHGFTKLLRGPEDPL